MKAFTAAARFILVMTILTGLIYPLIISAIAEIFFSGKAEGSLISRNGVIIGSELIAQKFAGAEYFQPRPSAIDYNPMPSGGSNFGPTSITLRTLIDQRRLQLRAANGNSPRIPIDLLCSSASGLDPHISPEAAYYQVDRILKTRDLDQTEKTVFFRLIDKITEYPTLGLLGEPRVNVLKLNLAVDSTVGVLK